MLKLLKSASRIKASHWRGLGGILRRPVYRSVEPELLGPQVAAKQSCQLAESVEACLLITCQNSTRWWFSKFPDSIVWKPYMAPVLDTHCSAGGSLKTHRGMDYQSQDYLFCVVTFRRRCRQVQKEDQAEARLWFQPSTKDEDRFSQTGCLLTLFCSRSCECGDLVQLAVEKMELRDVSVKAADRSQRCAPLTAED